MVQQTFLQRRCTGIEFLQMTDYGEAAIVSSTECGYGKQQGKM